MKWRGRKAVGAPAKSQLRPKYSSQTPRICGIFVSIPISEIPGRSHHGVYQFPSPNKDQTRTAQRRLLSSIVDIVTTILPFPAAILGARAVSSEGRREEK